MQFLRFEGGYTPRKCLIPQWIQIHQERPKHYQYLLKTLHVFIIPKIILWLIKSKFLQKFCDYSSIIFVFKVFNKATNFYSWFTLTVLHTLSFSLRQTMVKDKRSFINERSDEEWMCELNVHKRFGRILLMSIPTPCATRVPYSGSAM
jgi:hypothetical protein